MAELAEDPSSELGVGAATLEDRVSRLEDALWRAHRRIRHLEGRVSAVEGHEEVLPPRGVSGRLLLPRRGAGDRPAAAARSDFEEV